MEHDSTRVDVGRRRPALTFNPDVTIIQNDLIRYLFSDDDEGDDGAPGETQR